MLKSLYKTVVSGSAIGLTTLSYHYTRAKTRDEFLKEYGEDRYRIALRTLYNFASCEDSNKLLEYDELRLKWEKLEKHRSIESSSSFSKFESIDSARRLLRSFAVRLLYGESGIMWGHIPMLGNSDLILWDETFYVAVAKILPALEGYKQRGFDNERLFQHAEERLSQIYKQKQVLNAKRDPEASKEAINSPNPQKGLGGPR